MIDNLIAVPLPVPSTRNVVASHTVYAINMERILNSFEHQTVEAAEIVEEKRKNDERKATADQRQLLTRLW